MVFSTTLMSQAPTVSSGYDSYEPYYGVGVSYALFDNMSLRAEWEPFGRDDLDIDLMSAGTAVKLTAECHNTKKARVLGLFGLVQVMIGAF